MRFLIASAVSAILAVAPQCAAAGVLISIDKSTQRMTVSVDGHVAHVWAVSTGRAGYGTPNGHYRPQRMARSWFSRKYYNSPMPHAIFFHGGFAIHGSGEISRLGGPASHGCVRLHPANAAKLFALVKSEGMGATRIAISGASPARAAARTRPVEGPREYLPSYRRDGEAPTVYRPVYRPSGWGDGWIED